MNRKLLTAAILVLFLGSMFTLPKSAFAIPSTITRIQSASGSTTGTGSATAVFADNPVLGHVLILAFQIWDNSGLRSVASVAETGVEWHQITHDTYGYGASHGNVYLYYGYTTASSISKTVEVQADNTDCVISIYINEYSGIAYTGTLDKYASAAEQNNQASAMTTGTTAATTLGNELWFGVIGSDASSFSDTTNGFTILNGATPMPVFEKIVTATGAAECSATPNAQKSGAGIMGTFIQTQFYATVGEVTNPDDLYNIYAMKKYYALQAIFYDAEDVGEITKVNIKIVNGATIRAFMYGSNLNSTPTWSVSGDMYLNGTGCTWSTLGDYGTAEFKIMPQWDYPATSGADTIYVSAKAGVYNTTWQTFDTTTVVTRLAATNFQSNHTSPKQISRITGNIYYAISQTSNTSSSSYPPDAQFTSVSIIDEFGHITETNTTITNGAFSIKFNSTAYTGYVKFYAYVNMVTPYVDGIPSYVNYIIIVYTIFTPEVEAVFNFFGVLDFAVQISVLIAAFGTYFSTSVTSIVTLAGQIMLMLSGSFGVLSYWSGLFIGVFIQIGGVFSDLWYGVGSMSTGLGNITTFLGPNAFPLIAIWAVFSWIDTLPVRAKLRGVSWLELGLSDAQFVWGIFMIFFGFFHTIYDDFVNLILSIARTIGIG